MFIHLRNFSAYSLSKGAMTTNALVHKAKQFNMPGVAITDMNNMFGSLEFSINAMNASIQPIIGLTTQFFLDDNTAKQVVLLAKNLKGYRNLLLLMRDFYLSANKKIFIKDIANYADGLICLTGGRNGILNHYILQDKQKEMLDLTKYMQNIFRDDLYIELQRHNLDEEKICEGPLIDLAYKCSIPLVATNDCNFSDQSYYQAHDILLCIAQKTYVDVRNRLKSNPNFYFKSPAQMEELFFDIPEAINNTLMIAGKVGVAALTREPILPIFSGSKKDKDDKLLSDLAISGLTKRLAKLKVTDEKIYWDRLKFELEVISNMGYAGYFLIVQDFIAWAKKHDCPVGPGRGSGAGSCIAWAIGITQVDPLKFGLLFERFLNPQRVSLPDFDIDFCPFKRDKVVNYVSQKYGRDKVAHIITFGTLQSRAVTRDVGRVLGIPYSQVDNIVKLFPTELTHHMNLSEIMQISQIKTEMARDPHIKKLMEIAKKLEGLYRHVSTHAAGIIISNQRALKEFIPLYLDSASNNVVSQFNMGDVERSGLIKFDFLGLKTLTIIDDTLKEIYRNEHKAIDIYQIPLDDKQTYVSLAKGDTAGVFQLESRGMIDVIKKLKPDRFEDLIALISLYRPGPMENIPSYIRRKHAQEKVEYMHSALENTLKETLGIPIYQEQIMQMAVILADYSLAEADLLRRAMGKKKPEEMAKHRDIFVKRTVKKHLITKQKANSIFDAMSAFAGYGFNKSHATSYAYISYQTAWLKCHYKEEFFNSIMNLEISNTDKLEFFKNELARHNIDLKHPDINYSEAKFSIRKTKNKKKILYALGAIKGVGSLIIEDIINERTLRGNYSDIFDFITRNSKINKNTLENLIKSGAFNTIHSNKNELLHNIEFLLKYAKSFAVNQQESTLFGQNIEHRPPLKEFASLSKIDDLALEKQSIGFYLSSHPLSSYKYIYGNSLIDKSSALSDAINSNELVKTQFLCAGIVLARKQLMTKRKTEIVFVTLSDEYGSLECIAYPQRLAKSAIYLNENQLLIFQLSIKKFSLKNQDDASFSIVVENVVPLEKFIFRNITKLLISGHENHMKLFVPMLLLHKAKGASTQLIMNISNDTGQWNIDTATKININTDVIKLLKNDKKIKFIFD